MKGPEKEIQGGPLRRSRPGAELIGRLEMLGLFPAGVNQPGESRRHLMAGVMLFLGVSAVIGGFLWPYVFNSWLVRLGREPWWGFWHGFALGAMPFVGQTACIAALITWLWLSF